MRKPFCKWPYFTENNEFKFWIIEVWPYLKSKFVNPKIILKLSTIFAYGKWYRRKSDSFWCNVIKEERIERKNYLISLFY